MTKRKLMVLTLTPLTLATTFFVATSCNNISPDQQLKIKVTTALKNIDQDKDISIEDTIYTKAEQQVIMNKLAKIDFKQFAIKLNEHVNFNSFLITPQDVVKNTFDVQLPIDNKLHHFSVFVFSNSVKKFFDRNKKTTQSNNTITTTRSWEFKVLDAKKRLLDGSVNYTQNVLLKINHIPQDTNVIFDSTNKDITRINVDWNNTRWYEGIVTKWADGDTLEVKVVRKGPKIDNAININEAYRIRVGGIDTPEKAVGGELATPFEYQYAELSSAFGKKAISIGKTVRVLYSSKDAYGRLVGDIYFGDKFDISYSVEIVRSGYTLPMGSILTNALTKNNYEYYSYYLMALALEQAQKNKKGFFADFDTPEAISNFIYLKKPNTSFRIFLRGEKFSILNDRYKDKVYK